MSTHGFGDQGAAVAPRGVLPAGPWGVGSAAPPHAPGSFGSSRRARCMSGHGADCRVELEERPPPTPREVRPLPPPETSPGEIPVIVSSDDGKRLSHLGPTFRRRALDLESDSGEGGRRTAQDRTRLRNDAPRGCDGRRARARQHVAVVLELPGVGPRRCCASKTVGQHREMRSG